MVIFECSLQYLRYLDFSPPPNIADSNSCAWLSNGCPKEVRNPKLSGIPHRSDILSKAIARARAHFRGCNLASKFLLRRREIDRTIRLDVISLDLSAKLLANSQHQITTGQIPSKLNGRNRISKSRFRKFEALDCKR